METQMKKLITVFALMIISASPVWAQGPVILGGDDLTDHGSVVGGVPRNGWRYIKLALDNIKVNVTRPGNDGSVAALGSTPSTATSANAGAAIGVAAAAAGLTVTYHDGATAINNFFTNLNNGVAKPAIIWLAGTGAINNLDAAEGAALTANAVSIANFVNSGGGLMSHGFGNVAYGWLNALFPGLNDINSGNSGDLLLTAAGIAVFPTLTNVEINAGPWHNHFEGVATTTLNILVKSRIVRDSRGDSAAVIIGGRVTLPGNITLSPTTATNPVGSTHTVTALVRNNSLNPLPNITVTFRVLSGPNTGVIGTAVTNAVGMANFIYTSNGVAGTDMIQATFVDPVTGNTIPSNTVTKEWRRPGGELNCEITIITPKDGARVCDSVRVEGTTIIRGGVPPYTTVTCDVNGVPAIETGADSIRKFVATVPCRDVLFVTCNVVDVQNNRAVCRDTIRVVCPAPLVCDVDITSPQDSAVVCANNVTVTATTSFSGGVPPFTMSCNINGVPAAVMGTTFTATVPLAPGWNNLVATCTVTDSCGKSTVCSDTRRVFSIIDKTPPTCTFVGGYKSVTGTFFDNESGIAKIEPLFLFNARLTVDPFTPGAKQVNFRLDDNGEAEYLGFDIKITDMCGNTHVCDPVMAQLSADRANRRYTFNFRSVDRYLILTNHGLSEVRVDLNGHQFGLYSESTGGVRALNAYRMPTEGHITIDLQPYLRDGENIMRLEIEGQAGASANLLLIDEAHEIDHTLELQPIPTEFQLSQNYPNPFNPTTAIRFSIPARVAEGTPVQLRIYNTLGELVRILVDEKMFPGQYAVTWDGQNSRGTRVSSGIYIYQLVTGGFKQSKRMVVLQ
jgi:hypothetical protein